MSNEDVNINWYAKKNYLLMKSAGNDAMPALISFFFSFAAISRQ